MHRGPLSTKWTEASLGEKVRRAVTTRRRTVEGDDIDRSEMSAALGGGTVTATNDAKCMLEADRFLLYLDAHTWTDPGATRLVRELSQAMESTDSMESTG